MPFSSLTEAKELWVALGALAGAAAVLIVGWLKVRSADRSTDSLAVNAIMQRQLDFNSQLMQEIESQKAQIEVMHAKLADMDLALRQERASCDQRMSEIEARHRADMTKLEARLNREESR